MLLDYAFATSINSTAYITELCSTSAGHMVATFGFLHPEITLVALLEFMTLSKFDELIVVFVNFLVNLVFVTGHSHVVDCPAIETVVFVAHRTVELKVKLLVLLVKDESILAISSWTP
jgi:hypothetical protein